MIAVGLVVALATALAGMWWANRFIGREVQLEDDHLPLSADQDFAALRAGYGKLPSAFQAFAPIFVPILLICLGSIAAFPAKPFGSGTVFGLLSFLGQPVVALLVGLPWPARCSRARTSARSSTITWWRASCPPRPSC